MLRRSAPGLFALAVLAVAALLPKTGWFEADSAPDQTGGPANILALSWSPGFCARKDPSGRSGQCAIGTHAGLVVHGLWPQGRGEFCRVDKADRLPQDLADRVRNFMPSVSLARHEWQKHGTCSGLSQRDYFRAMEQAFRAFNPPPEMRNPHGRQILQLGAFKRAIQNSNKQLSAESISLRCGNGDRMEEIRVCLTSALASQACPAAMRDTCPATFLLLPPR